MIYVNKLEDKITFNFKTVYCLELLTSKTIILLGNNKSKITKDINSENVPHLEFTEVILVHHDIVENNLFVINHLVNY